MSQSDLMSKAELRDLLGDYRVAHAAAVAVELGIAELLTHGSRSSDELAHATNTHPRSLFRLMRALASVGIFSQTEDSRFATNELATHLHTAGLSSTCISTLPGGLPHERESWENLLYSVQTGESAFRHLHGVNSWEFHHQNPPAGEILHAGMSRGTEQVTPAILAAYSFSDATCVVDVGGGRGALLGAILQAYPQLHGILFDQPQAVNGAELLLRRQSVFGRCQIIAGDFFVAIPEGGDLYLIKSVLHNWDDASALRILENCRRAMPAESRLLLVEPVLDPENVDLRGKFLMDLHMLVIHGAGERTAAEFEMLLASAGFRLTRNVETTMMASLIEAVPAESKSERVLDDTR